MTPTETNAVETPLSEHNKDQAREIRQEEIKRVEELVRQSSSEVEQSKPPTEAEIFH